MDILVHTFNISTLTTTPLRHKFTETIIHFYDCDYEKYIINSFFLIWEFQVLFAKYFEPIYK